MIANLSMTEQQNSRSLINIGLTKSNEPDHVANDEDSSYDSDNELAHDSPHQNVSRTTSDTLGQEFAEYYSNSDRINYTQRVEFALKLGYTERLVQTALSRLGPNPTQNELLAELIKLSGAQTGSYNGDFAGEDPVLDDASSAPEDSGTIVVGGGLRPIVIDGSNLAMGHGNKEVFSCRGIRICVDYFKNRGHKDITVFVPKWRKEGARPDNPIKDQELLNELEKERMLVFTPSRFVGGKRTVCYDDRYILKLAADNDGIVVSNDNYRDLLQESSEFKKVVEERLLMYSFVNDRFMPPDDPLGKHGPTLDNFLKLQTKKIDQSTVCPYGKKCTYGNKCKFFHPERVLPHKSVTERLSEHLHYHLQARNSDQNKKQVQGKSLSVPINTNTYGAGVTTSSSSESFHSTRKPLCRTKSSAPESTANLNQLAAGQHLIAPQYMLPQPANQCWDAIPNMSTHNMDQHYFLKSHSIENIPRYNSHPNYQSDQMLPHDSSDISLNLHKKLQRQLTLNPGCDPRLFQLQQHQHFDANRFRNQINPHTSDQFQQHLSPHTKLTQSRSGGQISPFNDMHHQNVTRIASAPNSNSNWSNSHLGPTASASEPHINCWPQPIADQRRRLHYHLSSIFPIAQVEAAMTMYPDEVDPQKICSAILSFQNQKKST